MLGRAFVQYRPKSRQSKGLNRFVPVCSGLLDMLRMEQHRCISLIVVVVKPIETIKRQEAEDLRYYPRPMVYFISGGRRPGNRLNQPEEGNTRHEICSIVYPVVAWREFSRCICTGGTCKHHSGKPRLKP